jgi:glutamyl-tRNA synthetase
MLALLGWNPGNNQEIMSLNEMVELFTLERVSKSGAKFDPEKTKWFNQQYLRKRSPEELADMWLPELESKGIKKEKSYIVQVCSLLQEKAHFINEFWSLGYYFFEAPTKFDENIIKKRWNEKSPPFFMDLAEAFNLLNDFSAKEIENCFKSTCEAHGIKTGDVLQLLRVCISGVGAGPSIFELMALIGKEEIIKRIHFAVKKFK